MTTGGWIFLLIAWGSIITLVLYCYIKIITDKSDSSDEQSIENIYKNQ
jgi:hypothetical protein